MKIEKSFRFTLFHQIANKDNVPHTIETLIVETIMDRISGTFCAKHQNNSTNNGCDGAYAMSSSNFNSAKQTISKQSFEDTKLTTAKQILKTNCLTAAQIKEIMLLFSFEATRLELAKLANDRCVDKNNYFLLNAICYFI